MFMDVLIIGCVVNGLGEVEVFDLGLIGVCNMSGLYEDGKWVKECLFNDDLVDKFEVKIWVKVLCFSDEYKI